MAEERTEVEVSRSGIKLSSKDITTVAIVGTFFTVLGLGYLFTQHAKATDEHAVKLEKVFVDMAQAQRETGCIVAYRNANPSMLPKDIIDFCKQVAGNR